MRAGAAQELAFQLTDAQFSVIAVATPGKPGVVIDRIAYSPYGEATRTLRSDVNGDGFVNKDDYAGIIKPRTGAAIGTAVCVVEADLDRNGIINQLDYDISVADDGKSSSGGVGEAGLFSRGVRNSIGYCGYIFNEDSGLYTVRFRTYSPTLGRWLERDPAGYVDGMGLYEYVRGGAIDAVDPSGQWTMPASVTWRAYVLARQFGRIRSWSSEAEGCGIVVKRKIDLPIPILGFNWNFGHEWIELPEYDGGGRWWLRGLGHYSDGWNRVAHPGQARRHPTSISGVKVKPWNDGYTGREHDVVVWKTTRTHLFGGDRELAFGAFKGRKCAEATCEMIRDCLRKFIPSRNWGGDSWWDGGDSIPRAPLFTIMNECRTGVRDALSACCLVKNGLER